LQQGQARGPLRFSGLFDGVLRMVADQVDDGRAAVDMLNQ